MTHSEHDNQGGILYVIGTPIGNLGDLTERAKEILTTADLILCEDTRVTGKLLARIESSVQKASLHQHSTKREFKKYLAMLWEGKRLALVTDAGTPGISDPGGQFVEFVVMQAPDIRIEGIPGASAVITALSVCGFPADKFSFLGFPPNKKGRETYFSNLLNHEETVVFYESTHRIEKAVAKLNELMPERQIYVGRELTKLHETHYRGTVSEVTEQLKTGSLKGEFVVILAPKNYVR